MNNLALSFLMLASAFTNAASYTFSRIPESQEWKLKGSVYPEHPRMLNVRYEDFAFLNEIASERYYLFRPNVHEVISTNTVSVFECPPPVNAFQAGKAQDLLAETCGRVIEAFPTNGTMGSFTYGFPPNNAVEVGGASTFGDVSCGQAVTLIGGTDFKAPEIPDSVMSYATNIPSMAMRKNAIIEAYSTATGFDTNSLIVKVGEIPHDWNQKEKNSHKSQNMVRYIDREHSKLEYYEPQDTSETTNESTNTISSTSIYAGISYSCSKNIAAYKSNDGPNIASAVGTDISLGSTINVFDNVFAFSPSVITNGAASPRVKGEIELNLVFSAEYIWIRTTERALNYNSSYDPSEGEVIILSINSETNGYKRAVYLLRPTSASFAGFDDDGYSAWRVLDIEGAMSDVIEKATSGVVKSWDGNPDIQTPDPGGFSHASADAIESIQDRVNVNVRFLGAFLNYEINPTAKLGGGGQ